MAGGIGSRFWPMSTEKTPKQFLDFLGTGESLMQQTYNRVRRIFEPENILVVTHENYAALTQEHLPDLPEQNIILEPLRRNTAPCIASKHPCHRRSIWASSPGWSKSTSRF